MSNKDKIVQGLSDATDAQFVLVPREPTEEMLEAMDKANTIWSDSLLTWQEVARRVYKSALAAAPAPPAQGEVLSLVRRFADELRKWWSFDDGQRHTHAWHAREDFIEKKLPELLVGACAELATLRAQADALAGALGAMREELWVDFCLGLGTTQPPKYRVDEFNSRPIVRLIDATLAAYRGK